MQKEAGPDERCALQATLSCISDDERLASQPALHFEKSAASYSMLCPARQLILSFVLGDLTCYPRVAAIDSRFFLACTALGSWQDPWPRGTSLRRCQNSARITMQPRPSSGRLRQMLRLSSFV